MASARLAELRSSRRNIASAGPTAEGTWSRRTYPLIVLVHSVAIVGTLLRGRRTPSWPWLGVLLAAQPVRAWVLITLGSRWNTRAAVPAEMSIETRGPYRFVRHPNYSVVAAELLALPIAFGLPRFAALVSAANVGLLALRIPEEERLLSRIPGYTDHFASKPRFLPRMF